MCNHKTKVITENEVSEMVQIYCVDCGVITEWCETEEEAEVVLDNSYQCKAA